ncbi:unnamed protein product [Tilletia laevis]|uniref:Uncharacterized protein n=1 Tax=Tilletia caries TaxID=13290 RepID=A0A177UB49_9BASI|nr:hypothetical protein CF336_g2277 [Tilletia laevis]KAE8256502.1 hypothetical protein A4X03_0g5343 [Tilletia caries]CAD6918505.1 unnamed protein product [Tilletia controversa]KAE8202507.1 hypothetical protein CF335_g3389 [Tilletia laevis]CAD6884483.1 unnamed protein product [Tilletia caries]
MLRSSKVSAPASMLTASRQVGLIKASQRNIDMTARTGWKDRQPWEGQGTIGFPGSSYSTEQRGRGGGVANLGGEVDAGVRRSSAATASRYQMMTAKGNDNQSFTNFRLDGVQIKHNKLR